MLKDVNVYNVVAYDGVDAYVIKTIGSNENDINEQFINTDLKICEIDFLYTWIDFDKHLNCVFHHECNLGNGDDDLNIAIRRFLDVKLETELSCLG